MRKLLIILVSLLIKSAVFSQTIDPPGPLSICQGSSQVLTVLNPPVGATFQWQKNGVDSLGATFVSCTVNSAGSYRVILNGGGMPGDTLVPVVVNVNPLPVPSFTPPPPNNNICSGTAVQFNSSVTGGTAPYTYSWDFGGTGTSTQPNPPHVFTSLGCSSFPFLINLVVTDANGCMNSVANSLSIMQAPDVGLTDQDIFSPFSNCDNSPGPGNPNFTLVVQNSFPGSCVTGYVLNWGDSLPLPLPPNFSPRTHTYTQLGAFNLVITAFGSNGCNNSMTYLVANQSNPTGGFGNIDPTIGLCAPSTIRFQITGWQSNSPGTIYIVDYGDNISDTFTHPLNPGMTPDTVYHTYTSSSCPATSFTATLRAINACFPTPYTIGNIQVRIKPTASFTSPNPVCVGQNVCFTPNGSSGSTGGNCSTANTFKWDFGDGNISTSPNPCHIYSPGGTYTVTLIQTNPCGSDTFSRQICVTIAPSPSFTINNNTGCSPVAVDATNTTNTFGACGPVTYNWSVSYVPAYCGTSSLWNFANGTNASSVNPSFSFINPGKYVIRLTVTNACGPFPFTSTDTVRVKRPPTVSINAITPNPCAPATIHPVANVDTCGATGVTYLWFFPGGSPGSAPTLDPGIISYPLSGPYTITLTVTNACAPPTTANRSFTVNLTPVPVPNSDTTVCAGTLVPTRVLQSVPSATITWININNRIGSGAVGSGNILAFTANNPFVFPITDTFIVRATTGICFNVDTFTITVNPRPVIPLHTATICSGNSFSVTPVNGVPTSATIVPAGTTYSWSFPSGTGFICVPVCTGTNESDIHGTLNNTTSTPQIATYTVTPRSGDSGHCVGPVFQVRVTVNPKPFIRDTIISVCSGSMFSFTPPNSGGNIVPAGTRFSWGLPSLPPNLTCRPPACTGSNVLATISGTLINSTNGPLPAVFRVFPVSAVVLGNCAGDSFTVTVMVNPRPAIPLQTKTICSGETFTIPLFNGVPTPATIVPLNTNYSWPPPVTTGGMVGTFGTNALVISGTLTNNTPFTQTATYRVLPRSGTTGNCIGDSFTVIVTVNPKPFITTITDTICSGSTFSISPVNGGGNIVPSSTKYSWPPPILNGLVCTPLPCTGSNESNIFGTLTNSTNSAITAIYRVVPVSDTLGNYCVGDSFTVRVTVNPRPIVQNEDTAICSGQTFTITPSEITTPGNVIPPGTLYTWPTPVNIPPGNNVSGGISQPTGVSSISQTLTNITNPQIPAILRYTVTPTAPGNCPGAPFNVDVTVKPKPQLTSTLTPPAVCTNTPFSYLATSSTGDTTITSFTWDRPGTSGIFPPFSFGIGPLINETLRNTTSTYSPVQVDYNISMTAYGCSNTQAVRLVVNPDAKSEFTTDTTISCVPFRLRQHLTVTHYQDANDTSQYKWYRDNWIPIGTGLTVPLDSITQPGATVIIRLVAKSKYGCKDDTSSLILRTIQRPVPSFTINKDSTCAPDSIYFINTTTPISVLLGSTYEWDFGIGTSTAVQPGNIFYPQNPTFNDTVYMVKLKVTTACDILTDSLPVLIKSKPKALFVPDRISGCSPFTVIFANTSKGTRNTYQWDFGDDSTLNTGSDTSVSHIYYTGTTRTYFVKLRAINDCGIDSITIPIVVSPNTVNLSFTVFGNQLWGCAPHTVNFVNNSSGGSNFYWDFGDFTYRNTTNNVETIPHPYPGPGVYHATLRGTNLCADTTGSLTITIYQKLVPAFTADKYQVCIGETVSFTNQTDTATSYLWQFGDGNISTQPNPIHNYAASGLFRVTLTAFRAYPFGTCSDTISRLINVSANAPGQFDLTDSVGPCAPFAITFFNRNLPSVSAVWDFGDFSPPGSGNTVTHIYQHAGTYLVRLTSVDPAGCTYISQKTVRINGPDGVLLYNGGYYCNSQSVRFEATVSNTDSLVWDFGDGDTLVTTLRIVYHPYLSPGAYVPKVFLRSNGGCRFLIQGIDTIKVDYIKAGFTWSQQKFCGYTRILFTDTSHAYFGLQNFNWNFGDNTTGSGNIVSHDYASGTYTVRLIVRGNSNCTDTISHVIPISINSNPVAAIQADTSACVFSPVTLNAIIQSIDPVNIISWTISNGITRNGPTIIVNFALPNTYTIRLVTGTIYGCFDTVYQTIRINPLPVVTTNNNLNLCRGNTVQLLASGASQYSWSPLQGLSCGNCPNPIASPVTTTTYYVHGMNSFGCSGYDTVVISVIQPMTVTVSAGDSICIGNSVQLLAGGTDKYLWSPATGLNAINIPNPIATPVITTTYQVIGSDNYNCFSDTKFVTVAVGKYPTVNLGPDLSLSTGTLHTFNPIIQNGPIRDWLWTPATNLNCNTCPNPVATVRDNITYLVKVTTDYGCSAADTIKIKVFCEGSQVFIPNTFTPNGDGRNDIMMVRGTGILTVKSFRIFNRWGSIVFERNNFPPNTPAYGWNGFLNGKPLPPDVFVYTAEVICDNGTPYTFKGNITLVK